MPDSPTPLTALHEAVLEATLDQLGGELLEGSGFENEHRGDRNQGQVEGGEE